MIQFPKTHWPAEDRRKSELRTAGFIALLTALFLVLIFLCGCSSTNITKLVQAMAKDTNSVVVEVKTIYGSFVVYRNVPYKMNLVP